MTSQFRTFFACRKPNRARPVTQMTQQIFLGLAVVLCYSAEASSDIILNYQYSGAINSFDDSFGLFSQIAIGDSVSGSLLLCASSRNIDFGGGRAYYFDPSAGHRFNAAVATSSGLFDVRPSGEFEVGVIGADWSGGEFVGTQFAMFDGDPSILDFSGLPAGYSVDAIGFFANFFTTNLSLSTYPDLPTSLQSPSDYDHELFGVFFAGVSDGSGNLEYAEAFFSISSIQPVPEPGSSPVWLMIGITSATIRRRAQEKRVVNRS